MAMIDIRSPIELTPVSEFLLKVAEKPLDFIEQMEPQRLSGIPSSEVWFAARIGRQASAIVISNCVIDIWSNTVCNLHALEPDFPLYPKQVIKFVEDTRLPLLSYASLYYALCKKKFEGTASAHNIKIIVAMRNELQHDKPETSDDYSSMRVDKVLKWKKKLEPLVGKKGLSWLPRVRQSEERSPFEIGGEPPIMKFMKYPVAKWALESTVKINQEITDLMFAYKGNKKLRKARPIEEFFVDERFKKDSSLRLLWKSGE